MKNHMTNFENETLVKLLMMKEEEFKEMLSQDDMSEKAQRYVEMLIRSCKELWGFVSSPDLVLGTMNK